MKKIVIILSVVILLAAAAITVWIISVNNENNQRLVFYKDIAGNKVHDEYKQVAQEILDENDSIISKIMVTESSRSTQCIRWVFISENDLSYEEEKIILDKIFACMEPPLFPLHPLMWEVFFCKDETVSSAYVSSYGTDYTIGDPDDHFNYWYAVPNAGEAIPYKALMQMLKGIYIHRPMFGMGPIEGKTPSLPDVS